MTDDEKPVLEPKEQVEFIATARERFKQAAEEEKDIRSEALLDLKFVAGDQWDERVKADRIANGRPCMTFSRTHTFVQQVANEARQNKPQIKVVPKRNGDEDTAEVYEGLARHIQYSSDAQVAYETAVEYSAGGSFGFFRFITDYCDDETFDQDLKVAAIFDPMSVYGILMPACFGMEPKFGFVITELSKDEFKQAYPDSEIVSLGWDEAAKRYGDWVGDKVRIAEYWYVEETTRKLKVGKKERTVTDKTVKFCKISGAEVLPDTETVWPGYCIPIVPVLGKQMIVDGKPQLFSLIRQQRDAQRLINFYKTRIAETLGTPPISPFVAPFGAIPENPVLRKAWYEANTRNTGILMYMGYDAEGRQIPPPQRQVFEPPIAALTSASQQEIDDMKASAGIFDPSLGAAANETSGIAIQRRQQQSTTTNLHIMDNLERAFKKGGEIFADVAPKIYDTEREIRILGNDEAPKIVKINAAHQDENEKMVHYKVGGDGVGKYDIVVTVGKAFSTKRMESFDMMSSVLQANPQILPTIGDIFFANSDMAGADLLAERFKKMLPPQLQDEKDQNQQIPPQAQQMIQQLGTQLKAIDAHAQDLTQQLEAAKRGDPVKLEQIQSNERIAMAKMQHEQKLADKQIAGKFIVADAQADHEAAHTVLGAELGDISQRNAPLPMPRQEPQQPQV